MMQENACNEAKCDADHPTDHFGEDHNRSGWIFRQDEGKSVTQDRDVGVKLQNTKADAMSHCYYSLVLPQKVAKADRKKIYDDDGQD